jgi:hypothetical protein
MKHIKILLFIVAVCLLGKTNVQAQQLNWATLRTDQRHIANVNAGFDYAFTYGAGYGYHVKSKLPIVLNLEHSQPVGGKVLDDLKTKIGGQVRVYQLNNVHFIANVQGVFRRYENNFVRQVNFGSDLSAVVGYYKPKWWAAGEFGFDKAIVTHFKHSDLFKEDFPTVKNGWYQPAVGGNFRYGIQAGFSWNSNDVSLKAGKVIAQDFKTNPTIPFYFQLGYTRRF